MQNVYITLIDLTFGSGCVGDGGGVAGDVAAEPVSAVQVCGSTFVKRDTAGYFLGNLGIISSHVCGEKCFQPNHDVFLAPNQVVVVSLILTERDTALRRVRDGKSDLKKHKVGA